MPRLSKKNHTPEVSKVMLEALQMMLQGKTKSLYRWRGGFWSNVPQPLSHGRDNVPEVYFGMSTIKAIINRNLVDIFISRTSAVGHTFPIEIRLNNLSYEVLKCKQQTR